MVSGDIFDKPKQERLISAIIETSNWRLIQNGFEDQA
jgi:hypothetical protein